jgi:hypothetical protein
VLLERRRLFTVLAEEPKARRAFDQAVAEYEAAKATHDAAELTWKQAGEAYGTVTNRATATLSKATQARQVLIAGCTDKAAFNRWSIAQAKVAGLENQLSQQRQALGGSDSQGIIGGIHRAERELQMAEQSGLAKQMADCRAAIDGFRASRPRIEATIKTLEGELAGARKELAEAESVVCQP